MIIIHVLQIMWSTSMIFVAVTNDKFLQVHCSRIPSVSVR